MLAAHAHSTRRRESESIPNVGHLHTCIHKTTNMSSGKQNPHHFHTQTCAGRRLWQHTLSSTNQGGNKTSVMQPQSNMGDECVVQCTLGAKCVRTVPAPPTAIRGRTETEKMPRCEHTWIRYMHRCAQEGEEGGGQGTSGAGGGF